MKNLSTTGKTLDQSLWYVCGVKIDTIKSISFSLIYGGFGVLNWVFEGWGFQLMGFLACGVGPSGLLGLGQFV